MCSLLHEISHANINDTFNQLRTIAIGQLLGSCVASDIGTDQLPFWGKAPGSAEILTWSKNINPYLKRLLLIRNA